MKLNNIPATEHHIVPYDMSEIKEGTSETAEVSVVANGDPQKNPQKIMEAMRANPSITRNELAELIGMTPEGVKSAISSLKASGAIRRVGPDKGGHWEVVG